MFFVGDFRVALLDSRGKKIISDGFSKNDLRDMYGYNFHIFPHVTIHAKEYHDKRPGSGHGAMVPCNFCFVGT